MFTVYCYKPDLIGRRLQIFLTNSIKCFTVLLLVIYVLGKIFTTVIKMCLFLTFLLFLWFFFFFLCAFSTPARLSQPTSPLTSCRFARLCPPPPPQETRSGCQVRSSPRPPGTWSESLSASASPSASKVQTWQPCHSAPVGSPANKTIKKKTWITRWSQTPFGGWKSPANQLGRVCSRTAWREGLEPEQFSLDLEFNTEKSPQVMILISVID